MTSWVGPFRPAGIPEDISGKANAAATAALRNDTALSRLLAAGFEPDPTTPAERAAKIAHERVVLT